MKDFVIFQLILRKKIREYVQDGYVSLRHIKKIVKATLGVDIYHESIRQFIKRTDSLYYRDDKFKPSGYYGFDTQWVKIQKSLSI